MAISAAARLSGFISPEIGNLAPMQPRCLDGLEKMPLRILSAVQNSHDFDATIVESIKYDVT